MYSITTTIDQRMRIGTHTFSKFIRHTQHGSNKTKKAYYRTGAEDKRQKANYQQQ